MRLVGVKLIWPEKGPFHHCKEELGATKTGTTFHAVNVIQHTNLSRSDTVMKRLWSVLCIHHD
jgi:hypothetical protein